jgi:REP element-mobilizing transposase RayT
MDASGRWYHVMNRAVSRRPLFGDRRDVRFFLSRLAAAVRRGEIEVHAFCILTTHFHLLVRSCGQLSDALRRIQSEYARRFNVKYDRDGPLMRSRFTAKPVDDGSYRSALVRYIDFNPVQAGLVSTPELHPHGSARHYLQTTGPAWLSRDWVHACLESVHGPSVDYRSSYREQFSQPLSPSLGRLLERRLAVGAGRHDPLSDLVRAAPAAVRTWFAQQANSADGQRPCLAVVAPEDVEQTCRLMKQRQGSSELAAWSSLEAGLLRDLAGCSLLELSRRLGIGLHKAWNQVDRHRRLLASDRRYTDRAARVASAAIHTCWGKDGARVIFSPLTGAAAKRPRRSGGKK